MNDHISGKRASMTPDLNEQAKEVIFLRKTAKHQQLFFNNKVGRRLTKTGDDDDDDDDDDDELFMWYG